MVSKYKIKPFPHSMLYLTFQGMLNWLFIEPHDNSLLAMLLWRSRKGENKCSKHTLLSLPVPRLIVAFEGNLQQINNNRHWQFQISSQNVFTKYPRSHCAWKIISLNSEISIFTWSSFPLVLSTLFVPHLLNLSLTSSLHPGHLHPASPTPDLASLSHFPACILPHLLSSHLPGSLTYLLPHFPPDLTHVSLPLFSL